MRANMEDEMDDRTISDEIYMITPTQQILSSTIGALATSILVNPLDVVKTRLQAQKKNFSKSKCFIYCNGFMDHMCYCINGNGSAHLHRPNGSIINIDPRKIHLHKPKLPTQFNGTLDAIVKISRSEGPLTLWSGLPPTLIMAIPATVVYFTFYDRLRASMWSWYGTIQQPIWIPAFCGALSRCIAATAISPLELVRTKMQSKKLSYVEVIVAVRQLVKLEGIVSLWRGLGPTLMRDVPFSSIYWASYEFLKEHNNQRSSSLQFSLPAGAASGAIAAIATLPFDVVKTHRQIELGEHDLSDPAKKNSRGPQSINHILKGIYKQHGISGLFSGIVPRVIKVAPSCAIMISCYEYGKQFFARHNREKSLATKGQHVLISSHER